MAAGAASSVDSSGSCKKAQQPSKSVPAATVTPAYCFFAELPVRATCWEICLLRLRAENENRTQWLRSLAYPSLLFVASLVVFTFLCIAVVPIFSSIYDEFDTDLPTLTVWMVQASNALVRKPIATFLSVLVVAAAIYAMVRLVSLWGLPGRVFGALTRGSSRQVTAMARFTRRLAESLDAGLELSEALQAVGSSAAPKRLRDVAFGLAWEAQREGFDINQSRWARCLPAIVVHALQAGPGGKPVPGLLHQLAELYSARVSDRYDLSMGLLVPLAVVAMGLVVAVVVLSLYLPLLTLINGLTG